MLKAKILVVGPPKCGKTVLSNFLSDATENIGTEYRPTKGVRIVEFERRNLNVKGTATWVDVGKMHGNILILIRSWSTVPCYVMRISTCSSYSIYHYDVRGRLAALGEENDATI